MRLLLVHMVTLFSFLQVGAQVQSSAYNLTLKALLSHTVPEISVSQLKQQQGVIFVDAREWNEFRVSHIKNARHVGYDKFDINQLNSVSKSQKIVVYCSVGYRSEKISEKLEQAGYIDVSNLYGGIFEWINQGNPVVDEHEKVTENIHAYNRAWGVWLSKGIKVYDTN